MLFAVLSVLVMTVQARPEPIYDGQEAWYDLTLRNTGESDQMVDLQSVRVRGATFVGPDSHAAFGEIQTDVQTMSDQKCRDTSSLAVIKPGAAKTVPVIVAAMKGLAGPLKLTVEVELWRITDLPSCTGESFTAHPEISIQVVPTARKLDNLDKLNAALNAREIAKVTVLRIPDEVMFDVGATERYLRENADYAVTFGMVQVRLFDSLLPGISAKNEDQQPDLRWGVLFYDLHGNEVGSLFVDRSGEDGYLAGQSVSFHAPSPDAGLAPRLRKILASVH